MSEQRSFVPTPNEIEDLMAKKDAHIKEQWVKTMEIRLVRDELNKCYKGEGVNATEHCKDLALRYLGMLKSHKMEGFRKIEKEDAPTHL